MSTKHERAIEAAIEAGHQRWRQRGANEADAWAAGIAAYQRIMREPGPGEVRVEIWVAVGTEDGKPTYDAIGWQSARRDACTKWDADVDRDDDQQPQYCRVVANVPAWAPPAEVTVEGEVSDA